MRIPASFRTLCVLVTLMAAPVFAQPPGGPRGPSVEQQLDNLKSRLSLTDDQAATVHGILLERQAEMTKAREKASGDRDAMRKAAAASMQKYDREIEAVLDAGQKKEFAQLREEQKKEMQQRREQREKEIK